MKTLVVEDNSDIGPLFVRMLKINGHDARLAASPAEALQVAREWQPEFVFLDLGLPTEEDGYGLAIQLRAEAGLSGAKIIALSGFGPDEQRQLESGIDGHFMKPVKLQTALDLLNGQSVILS